MPGALLRSGRLSEFRPLGAVGNPVYSSATQLRAAMRHQIGPDVANLFAVPKQHDRGDVIDWYAPEDGDVVPWSSATPAQREQAKAALVAAQEQLAERSRELQAHEGSEQKVFGKLLAQAIKIPSDEHVYLVNDKPVVTFWGFVPLDAPSGLDVIGELDTSPRVVPVPPPVVAAPVVVEERRRLPWWLWLLLLLLLLLALLGLWWWWDDWRTADRQHHQFDPLGGNAVVLDDKQIAATTSTTTTSLPAGMVVRDGRVVEGGGTTGGVAGEGTGTGVAGEPGTEDEVPSSTLPEGAAGEDAAGDEPTDETTPTTVPDDAGDEPTDEATPTTVPADAGTTPTSVPPGDETTPSSVPPGDGTTPTSVPPGDGTTPTSVPPGAGTTPTSVPTPPDVGTTPPTLPGGGPGKPDGGTPLTIPKNAASTDFLNGKYRSNTGLQDEAGNPVDLEYDFEDGKGTVSATRPGPDGKPVTCSGAAGSRMQNGKLVIDQGAINCPGGGGFQAGTVECVAGQGGRAECEGKNKDGSDFDVRIAK